MLELIVLKLVSIDSTPASIDSKPVLLRWNPG